MSLTIHNFTLVLQGRLHHPFEAETALWQLSRKNEIRTSQFPTFSTWLCIVHIYTDKARQTEIRIETDRAEYVLQNCMRFCLAELLSNRHVNVALTLGFIRRCCESNEWLICAHTVVLPRLPQICQEIIAFADVTRISSKKKLILPLSDEVRDNKHAIIAFSAVFELCLPLCDVDSRHCHLFSFVKYASCVLATPGYLESEELNATQYALTVLVRSASRLLATIFVDFSAFHYPVKPPKVCQVVKCVEVLAGFRDFSTVVHLVVALRVLYQYVSRDIQHFFDATLRAFHVKADSSLFLFIHATTTLPDEDPFRPFHGMWDGTTEASTRTERYSCINFKCHVQEGARAAREGYIYVNSDSIALRVGDEEVQFFPIFQVSFYSTYDDGHGLTAGGIQCG